MKSHLNTNRVPIILDNLKFYLYSKDDILIKRLKDSFHMSDKKVKYVKKISIDKFRSKINHIFEVRHRSDSAEQWRILLFAISSLIEAFSVKKNIFFLHGCSFCRNNNTYVFIGPSGSGKTTIIQKIQYPNRLSNDTTIIKKELDKFYVYSSAFDKNYNSFSNKKRALLKKIFILRQAGINKVTEPSLQDKLTNLMENNLLTMNDRNLKLIINIKSSKLKLNKLILSMISSVPVKYLFFKKNISFINQNDIFNN